MELNLSESGKKEVIELVKASLPLPQRYIYKLVEMEIK